MSLTKMINATKLHEQSQQMIKQQFVNFVCEYELGLDLTQSDDSTLFNNWVKPETRAQFNIFVAGASLSQPAFAAHSFGVIAGEVHDELNGWDEDGLGMASDLLFFINDLYIKHFGVGFMTIVEKKPEPKTNNFSVVD